jgi:hypothetical protein
MVGKAVLDHLDCVARGLGHRRYPRLWKRHAGNGRSPITGVVVPLTTRRFVSVHERARMTTHGAVERLHRDAFFSTGEQSCEISSVRNEVRVRRHLDRNAERFEKLAHALGDAVFRLLHEAYRLRLETRGNSPRSSHPRATPVRIRASRHRSAQACVCDTGVGETVRSTRSSARTHGLCRRRLTPNSKANTDRP